jgi:hypothetical protein
MSARILALALAVVMLVTFATPAKAEALEPMTILAIAGAAVIVVVLIVYLVVANVEGPKMSERAPLDRLVLVQEPAPALAAVDAPSPAPDSLAPQNAP